MYGDNKRNTQRAWHTEYVEKKQASTLYIAITYILTAAFVVPFLAGVVYVFLINTLLTPTPERWVLFLEIIGYVVQIGALWFGAKYAAGFLRDRYVIREPHRVVRWVGFIVAVLLFGIILNVLLWVVNGGMSGGGLVLADELVFDPLAVLSVAVFYVASRMYLLPRG
jgi:hypothetical protein